jgi:ceramide glucosyltransferase
MGMVILGSVVTFGLVMSAVMVVMQRQQLGAAPPAVPQVLPAVSVLKPMKGADPALAENLESFFHLDYPNYEVLLGVDDAADPACEVAARVIAAHPEVRSRLIVDAREVGLNPKVNNLARLLRHARHEAIWISDSNTRVAPATLREMAAHLEQPGVGLVSSPFRGVASAGLGGALEALQLNTFVMGGVSAAQRLLHEVCVVGKSMLLRRSTLGALGGFSYLGRFLAEDQVCGEEIVRLGRRVVLAGRPVENVLGPLSVQAFLARHLRWAKIRRRMNPVGYAGEFLLNPVFIAACGALATRTRVSLALVLAALLIKSTLDAAAESVAGIARPLPAYPLLTLAKDLLTGLAWTVPFVSTRLTWRGNRFYIGSRTLLSPVRAAATAVLGPASAEANG